MTRTGELTKAAFPDKLGFLFRQSRYKIAYGGRGAAKSWGVARALLIKGAQQQMRILCARELQNSIADSVHRLLADQIEALGLSSVYEVQRTAILGLNGTTFAFEGLRHNVNSIKSFEGVDVCWVEEAQTVSKASWDTLIPTIRKEGSEIWVTFNPELDSDETYVRFVKQPPPDAIVAKVNWSDNPWFPDVLRGEMEHMRTRDPDGYLTIWEGHCRQTLDGAIYAREIRQATEEGRITRVPYDQSKPVHTFWDLGWADNTAIWFAQVVGFEYRVIDYLEGSQRPLTSYLQELQGKGYVYGTDWIPHDGQAKQLGTGRSVEEMMRAAGRTVRIVPKLSVADGINAARTVFPNCWFDADKCADGLQCLRRYRYDVDAETGQFSRVPLHDSASHGCLTADAIVETMRGPLRIDQVSVGDEVWTPSGYAKVTHAGLVKLTSELIEVTLEDGRRLVCTPEHKIATRRGFLRADTLRYSDRVLSGNEWNSRLIGSFSRAAHIGFREIITVAMNGESLVRPISTELFGRVQMALSRMGLKFTTRTATRLITSSQTLSASMLQFISGSMRCNDMQRGCCSLPVISRDYALPNGTEVRKGLLGIDNTAARHGIRESGLRSIVTAAVRLFARLILRAPNGATSIARWRRFGSEGEPVYDLTVEKHACYRANGLLVSNSDAFRYLSLGLKNSGQASNVPKYVKPIIFSTRQAWMR